MTVLLSIGVAYVASLLLNLAPAGVPECVCVDVGDVPLRLVPGEGDGAIAGAAGHRLSRLSGRTLTDFVLAWTVTPAGSAAVAAAVFAVLR